jgi:hypothetical protein
VKAKGFKALKRENITLQANDRLTIGAVSLEVGQVDQVVEVTAEAVALKTESAERSDVLVTKQLENIAVNGRSYLALAALTPGVVSTGNFQVAGTGGLGNISANGSRMNQNQLTLNGISNVDTGNNGDQLATISLDSVQEYRILTGVYQAEYGRSSGAQINVVTKSGTSGFHGSGYYYRRHDSLNANDWLSNRDGRPRKLYRFNNPGYTIGGPVILPGVNKNRDKLFFFWSQEYQDQLQPEGVRRVTVPTDLERQGNFSQSIDRNGNRIYVKDYTLNRPCHAGDTSGCFANNIIPTNRLYQPGLALMKLLPAPTADKAITRDYNLESQISTSKPRREDLIRIDYNISEKLRFFGHYINNKNSTTTPYGSFVLGSNLPSIPITDARPGKSLGLGLTMLISPTSTNEFTLGRGRNDILIAPAAGPGPLTRAATGATLPVLYPDAVQDDYVPAFSYGGSRIANSNSYGTGRAPFVNFNETWDVIDNFSKVTGGHLLKLGLYLQKSLKDQSPDGNPNGNYNFGDTSQVAGRTGEYLNPYDTGYGFSNMALGVFDNFEQNNRYYMGKYRYWNAEWYVQDTWKLTRTLTLDYGLRMAWIQPQYEATGLASGFRPENYNPAQAVRLYRPGRDAAGNSIAVDPGTGAALPAYAIGRVVPNSGNFLNGVVVAGKDGVSKYLMEDRGIHWGPRFGLAWDVTGTQKMVVRTGGGIYYDRYQGNRAFSMTNNPPNAVPARVNYGIASELNSGVALAAVPNVRSFDPNGEVPTTYNYSFGIQYRLPLDVVLDTSYVGSIARHLQAQINLNAIPYGALFRPENQGITDRNFIRPFMGLADITYNKADATSNYNSLQVSLNRRMASRLFFGVSYTWSKALTTASGDGDFARIDTNNRKANYGLADFHRAHNLGINWVYEIPTPEAFGNPALKHTLGGWQLSGVYMYQTGTPQNISFSIPGTANETFTGSFTEGARIRLVGDPTAISSKDEYHMINPAAFAPPTRGSAANPLAQIGMEAPNRYFILPGINNWTLSLQKRFRIKEAASLQFRIDAFNAFNHTQFSDIQRTANFNNDATGRDATITNLPRFENGRWVNPTGFGAVTTVRDPRIVQLMARLQF